MNQLVGKKPDGTPFLALELEPGNLHRLQQGDPIVLSVHSLFAHGVPKRLELMLTFTETPIQSARDLAKLTPVAVDERAAAKKKLPHCPECHSTIEQLGVWRNESPIALAFCMMCGCVFGVIASKEVSSLQPAAQL